MSLIDVLDYLSFLTSIAWKRKKQGFMTLSFSRIKAKEARVIVNFAEF